MTTRVKLDVQSFPRPPLLEKISRHLLVVWDGRVIADTRDAFWVLETYHPPTYYFPPVSVKVPLKMTHRNTYCEWKSAATYYSIAAAPHHSSPEEPEATRNRIWSYESPTPGFKAIQGCLSFYPGPWECFVDGEKVEPQPGDFYGGWVTLEVEGIIKGTQGSLDPNV